MNVIVVSGNLTKDAEIRTLSDGTPVAGFAVADNQGKDKPAIFWNASLFGKRAQSLSPYLLKGQPVTITGTLTEREYTNKDGATVKAQDIRVNDVALQGGAKQAAAPAGNGRDRDNYDFPQPGGGSDMSDIPFAPIPRAALMSI